MRMENPSTLNSSSAAHGAQEPTGSRRAAAGPEADKAAGSDSLFDRHKGKLAVGAAAMLGIAIFYKWREHQLASEDPDEYARLQRLKHAVKDREPQPPAQSPDQTEK